MVDDTQTNGTNFICTVIAFISVSVFVIFAIINNPDTDAFFLVHTGQEIMKAGHVPTENTWLLHEGWKTIIQQPILCLLNSWFAGLFGIKAGTIILTCFLFTIAFGATVLYASTFIQAKSIHTILLLLSLSALFFLPFSTSRPYMMTAATFLTLHWCLYKYNNSHKGMMDKAKFLFLSSLLVLWQANFQSASLIFFIIFFIPFVFPDIRKPDIKTPGKEVIFSITAPILWFGAACLNPSGIKGALYLYYSYGAATKGDLIQELQSPGFISLFGIWILITFVLFIAESRRTRLRKEVFYVSLGCLLLSVMHIRNTWTLIFPLIPLISSYIETAAGAKKKMTSSLFTALCVILTAWTGVFILSASEAYKSTEEYLPEITKEIKAQNAEDMVLFASFHYGNYFEYLGYKPYMDARPELLESRINGKDDVYSEYVSVMLSETDFKEFCDKYSFTDLIVYEKTPFETYLKYNEDYERILQEEKVVYYRKKAGFHG